MEPPCSTASLFFVDLEGATILQQLRWEEALLRADQRNWCLINRQKSSAIVLGISGKLEEAVDREKYKQQPVPLLRRFSGGGTVFIDENTLFITLICHTAAISIPPFPHSILSWNSALYRPLFKDLPFSLRENDYVLGDKKWGGNALSVTKQRWLQHTSLLWDYEENRMNYLLPPIKTPSYRNQRPHRDFLCRLKEYWPSADHFFTAFSQGLHRLFSIETSTREELQAIERRPHRKATQEIFFTAP